HRRPHDRHAGFVAAKDTAESLADLSGTEVDSVGAFPDGLPADNLGARSETIDFARARNPTSTFSPVFAELRNPGTPSTSLRSSRASCALRRESDRSTLLPTTTSGMASVTDMRCGIQ